MVSDKTIHMAFKVIKLNKQSPFENFNFFYFTIYQNYSSALIDTLGPVA